MPAPTTSPAPTPTLPAGTLATRFRFVGSGYGHGVGLSQHGARGRALAGQDAATILAHYFPGTRLGRIDPAHQVRVLVLDGFAATSSRPLRVYGRSGPWRIAGGDATFPANAVLQAWHQPADAAAGTPATWRYRVLLAGTVLASGTFAGSLRLEPAAAASRLQLFSKPSVYDLYRGDLRLVAVGTRLRVVNGVGLDLYLRGVVPAEMPAAWPAAALEAQAVTARSYAARRLRPGSATWDLSDTWSSQVYRGVRAERTATSRAVLATRGIVLMAGSSIASTFFHSTGGGATEASRFGWVSPSGQPVSGYVPYLRGGPDVGPDGRPYDRSSPHATWATATLTRATLGAILARDSRTAVGTPIRLVVTRRGVSGRIVSLTLIGTAGTRRVSGDVFRTVYNAYRPAGSPMMLSTLVSVVAVG